MVSWGYGGSPRTTNNLMEVEGAIRGIEAALSWKGLGESFELVSDSQYALGLAQGTSHPSVNLVEAAELRRLTVELGCRCRWVPGHAGERWNETCDQLAKQGKADHQAPGKRRERAML